MPCVAYHYRMISHMPLKESEVLAVPENNIQYRWISLQEVCDYLGVKRHTIMRWIEQRGMPASKVGNSGVSKLPTLTNGLKKAEPPMSGRLSNERT
jgi:excisionase family DNA binding protein